MITDIELTAHQKLVRCDKHRIQYNAVVAKSCPMCLPPLAIMSRPELAQFVPELKKKMRLNWRTMKFVCPHCHCRTKYEGTCSKYYCRKAAGLLPPIKMTFKCKFCQGKTKNEDRVCTNYPCRQKGGKVMMYARIA